MTLPVGVTCGSSVPSCASNVLLAFFGYFFSHAATFSKNEPELGPYDVLIRVEAAPVNPSGSGNNEHDCFPVCALDAASCTNAYKHTTFVSCWCGLTTRHNCSTTLFV